MPGLRRIIAKILKNLNLSEESNKVSKLINN